MNGGHHLGGEMLPSVVYPAVGEPTESQYRPTSNDQVFMQLALDEATQALERGNYPVGALLVNTAGDIWTAGADEHSSQRLGGHAESNVIEKYNRDTGVRILSGLALYVTFVPCVGCSYKIDQGELGMLYYAADRTDVNNAIRDIDTGKVAVREGGINMPDILHESPRTLYVVRGLMKAASVELFLQKHWRDQENLQGLQRLAKDRRRNR